MERNSFSLLDDLVPTQTSEIDLEEMNLVRRFKQSKAVKNYIPPTFIVLNSKVLMHILGVDVFRSSLMSLIERTEAREICLSSQGLQGGGKQHFEFSFYPQFESINYLECLNLLYLLQIIVTSLTLLKVPKISYVIPKCSLQHKCPGK